MHNKSWLKKSYVRYNKIYKISDCINDSIVEYDNLSLKTEDTDIVDGEKVNSIRSIQYLNF